MKNSVKTKPVKVTPGGKLLPQPAKPLKSDSSASSYNPTVLLKFKDEVVFKIDLWALAMLYAPSSAMKSWNCLELYLDGKQVKE